ncbi:MAG: PD-(D/E)XK nuclease family protein [Candidatus Limiplasma sp.]|nr:PD-(D/E)XK nuclease family protein [Candidatus Limiplasma sp.]MEA5146110.1 PD-(D/E)XK nuclease family protein [Candidatus Limiplasma sp.]
MPEVSVWLGRPHRLLQPVVEAIGALHAQGKPSILLVPEQFTLQAERELLERLRLPGFFTIDVLSPTRFAQRVTDAVGADPRAPLSAAGRRMAVSLALEKCEKKLAYYQSAVYRLGFAEKLTALITDMKRGGLSPDALLAYAQALPEGMRRVKLTDLATVFQTYEAALSGRFGDGEDQLRYIAARLPESGLLGDKHIFVYGFDALPAQLMDLLCAAAPLCQSLSVALLCAAETAPDAELYRPVRQSVQRFALALRERGVALREVWLPHAPLPHAPAIRHLDEALFCYPERRFTQEQRSIFLSQHMSPFEEATYAARQVMRLLDGGMNIERIAVLYPDQNGYAFAVDAALRDSGLPYYTDEKLPAATHGLVRFLLAAIAAMAGEWQTADLVAVMKSGFAPLTFEEACELENYARAFGINRKKWLAPFTRGAEQCAANCERLRERLMAPLTRARAAIVAARDAQSSLAAVMGLLTDVQAYEALQREEAALTAENMLVRAGQNSQIWQTVLDILEQLHAIADGARIPLSRLGDRLACGFAAVTLGALPPASQMLHAGVLGHSLSGEMDAVFLLGLNDGVLSRTADSLLSEDERAATQEATGAYLGMTDESRARFARMDVKTAMTLPTTYLFVSYAKTDPTGKALRPLDLLAALQERLFHGLPQEPVPERDLPYSAAQAMQALSGLLRGYADGGEELLPQRWRARLARLLSSPATAHETARLLRAADYRVQSVPLAPDAARALFHDRTLSVSRLEEFAACPFRHFVNYGLRPEIVRDWGVDPIDLGVFFHTSLQNFAALASGQPAYPHIPVEQADALADAAVQPLLERLLAGPMGDSPRSLAGLERAKRIVRRACRVVTEHLAAGQFTLYKAEARFGYPDGESLPPVTLRLADGTEVVLQGKIDRIDRFDAGEERYLRVVDYKSSKNTVEAAKTWWGLQLQLMVYLDAAVGSLPGSQPAGAFYFHVNDPLAQLDVDEPALAEAEILKQLQMKGVALADDQVLNAMDQADAPIAIGAMTTKGGALRKDARVLDRQQMHALLSHARAQAAEMAQQLYQGDTAILPVKTGNTTSCQTCDFQGVCGFHADARGAETRELPDMSMDELRACLEGEGAALPAQRVATGTEDFTETGGEPVIWDMDAQGE